MKISKRIADAVKAGIAYLNAVEGPMWVDKIDTKKLDLNSTCNCVLGQLDGNYGAGLEKRGIVYQYDSSLGFSFPYRGPSQYKALTSAWRRSIRRLQRKRAPVA